MIGTVLRQLSTNRERIQRLSKEGAWIVAGQIVSVIGALVLVRVLTEHLDPAQYGELALGLTIAGLVNQVVMGGVAAGISRFYSIAAEKGDLLGYLKASRRLIIYATLAVGAIALVIMAWLHLTGRMQWIGLAIAVLVFSILSGINSTLSGIQNAARQRTIVAMHSGMDAWLKIGLAVGVILWLGATSTAAVIGYVLSALIVTVSQMFLLGRILRTNANMSPKLTNENWTRQIWLYAWPFSVWGVFTWAQQVSDRWALETFATRQDVGQYAVLFQLGYAPIGIVTGMVILFMGPILYQRSGDGTDSIRNTHVHQLVWRITFACLLITMVGFGFTFTLHAWLIQLLVAEEYQSISYLLPWVVLAGGLFATAQLLSSKLHSERRTHYLVSLKVLTSVIGIMLSVIFAKIYGLPGVVASLLIFSIIHLLWMMALTISNSGRIDHENIRY